MQTRGAVITKAPGKYEVVDLQLEGPRQGEIQVAMVASGLCHSDDHTATGDQQVAVYPWCGGHEGAGVVEAVGPHTPDWEVGDHVVFSYIPSCGRCRWCASGLTNLCDLGMHLLSGTRFADPSSYRLHLDDGSPVGQMCGIGTFAEHTTVDVRSAIKIADKSLPLEKLCLLGCGVGTGWGSAVYAAEVRPGDTVIVMGIGGIGINSVQGAAHAGALHVIAVDPVAWKREQALTLGATEASGDIVAQAFSSIRKAGTVVVTALGDLSAVGLPISLGELTLFQKRLQGALFGASNPHADIPRQVELYQAGQLKLDELVTREYSLDEIATGYEDMHAGRNMRGVIRF